MNQELHDLLDVDPKDYDSWIDYDAIVKGRFTRARQIAVNAAWNEWKHAHPGGTRQEPEPIAVGEPNI